MIVQSTYLPVWDWEFTVFFDSVEADRDILMSALRRIDCHGRNLDRALKNLSSGKMNQGLTFSNIEQRESVMIISRTSGRAQFWNTIEHEKGHLTQHIAQACGIKNSGEEYQYLAGAISQELYPVASMFLCGCQSLRQDLGTRLLNQEKE